MSRSTPWLATVALLLTASASASAFSLDSNPSNLIRALGPQGINLLQLQHKNNLPSKSQLRIQDSNRPQVEPEFPAHYFQQPLDHFDTSGTNATFAQRYWVSTRHYVPGAPVTPVFVLDGGETSGEDRLPFLDTGSVASLIIGFFLRLTRCRIVDILTAATGGVGVILEHRYYGTSPSAFRGPT